LTAQERIREKLVELTGYISDLEAQHGVIWDEFETNTMLRRGIECTLQMSIECLLDVGNMLIAARKRPAPGNDRAVFEVLVQQGVIPVEALPHYTKMASFRNILVHEYTRVDPLIVYGVLKRGTTDLERFRDHAAQYLARMSLA
jgi:uncharacterized protein YutE (UPF0331/DUF86 family)